MPLKMTKKQAQRLVQHTLFGETPEPVEEKKYRDNEEAREQALLFAQRQAMMRKYRCLRWVFATLNGVYIPPAILKQMLEQGIVRGVLDIFAPALRRDPDGSVWCGVVIDMKSEKGRPSTEQLEWAEHLAANGWRVYFCHSAVEAWRVLCGYYGITGDDHLALDMVRQSDHMKTVAAALKAGS